MISRDGRDGSATIHQDADVYRIRLTPGQTASHALNAGRGAWFQLIQGTVSVNGTPLEPGDAVSTEDSGDLSIIAGSAAEGLLFDLK
ncbi:MAG: hypothetical protein R3F31_09270 [Verrucomicrobiales bacterium]